MSRVSSTVCALCAREMRLTFHHLIPKKTHNKQYVKRRFSKEECQTRGIDLCKDCHRMIHKTFSHKELALEYNTKEKLLEHEAIDKFLRWIKKQRKRAKLKGSTPLPFSRRRGE